MKHIMQVLRFEYFGIVKSKSFIITTVLFLVLIIGFAFLPGLIMSMQSSDNDQQSPDSVKPVIAICDKAYNENKTVKSEFEKYYKGFEITFTKEETDKIIEKVNSQEYRFAVILNEPLSFKYVTKNNSLISNETDLLSGVLKETYETISFEKLGISPDESSKIINAKLSFETITTGTDQTKNYIPAYILMMVIYMAVIMYGQLVAQSVVTEKNSRAMEMLITCAKPSHLMFGKVIGSGLAGITQLALIVCTALVSMSAMSKDVLPPEIAEMIVFPVRTALYALLFFVLGYFIYSFLLGALASFASRSEDLNTLITPVMLIVVAAFMIVVMAINTGTVDSTLMIVCSYIPFTAPVAMFARIALSDVAAFEIIISVIIQIISVYLLGMLASAIYRIGVLMYGKVPKPSEIISLLKEQHKTNKALKASRKAE